MEKEIKNKEVELQVFKDESHRKEEMLKSTCKGKRGWNPNVTKAMNKQIEEFKNKLATIEKNRVSEDAKLVDLKDELKRRDIEYLDNLKTLQKEMKQKRYKHKRLKKKVKK